MKSNTTNTLILLGVGALAWYGLKTGVSNIWDSIFKKSKNNTGSLFGNSAIDGANYNEESNIIWGESNIIDEGLHRPDKTIYDREYYNKLIEKGYYLESSSNGTNIWRKPAKNLQSEEIQNTVFPGYSGMGLQSGYTGTGTKEQPYRHTATVQEIVKEEAVEISRKQTPIGDIVVRRHLKEGVNPNHIQTAKANANKSWAEKDEEVKSLPQWKQEAYYRNRLANAGY